MVVVGDVVEDLVESTFLYSFLALKSQKPPHGELLQKDFGLIRYLFSEIALSKVFSGRVVLHHLERGNRGA